MGPNGIWGVRTGAGPLPWADILPHPPGEVVASPANPGSFPRPAPGVLPQRSSQAGRVGRQWLGSRWGTPRATPEAAEAAEAANAAVRAATAAAAAAPPQALPHSDALPRTAQAAAGPASGAAGTPPARSERAGWQLRADRANEAAGPGPGSQRGSAADAPPPRGQPRARGPRGGQRGPRAQRTLHPGRTPVPEAVPLDWDAPAEASGRRPFQSGPRRGTGGAEGGEQGGDGLSQRARAAPDARPPPAEPALLRRGLGSTADFFTQVRAAELHSGGIVGECKAVPAGSSAAVRAPWHACLSKEPCARRTRSRTPARLPRLWRRWPPWASRGRPTSRPRRSARWPVRTRRTWCWATMQARQIRSPFCKRFAARWAVCKGQIQCTGEGWAEQSPHWSLCRVWMRTRRR